MKDIKCPKCGTVFQVDESDYAAIVEQVRNKEYQKDLDRRIADLNETFKAKEESLRLAAEKSLESKISEKERAANELANEITRLKGVIAGYEATSKTEIAQLESRKNKELFDALSEKDRRISQLESAIANKDNEHRIALIEEHNSGIAELQKKEQEIVRLQSEIKSDRLAAEKHEAELLQRHQLMLQSKEDEINRLKDYKLRQSTKMVGEDLEQHCANLFEEAQSMGQFPGAEFGKDNTAVDRSKGDFIFRDYIDGKEYVSIMFEMKNEMDATATKHKNDDFLEKLDKDRRNKNCEYAVLVSMLEQDSKLYEAGIVDKSHRYPKMIVIRPQFFLPVLRLITEAARKGFMERVSLQHQLDVARNQSLDFSKFEERMEKFRTAFGKSVSAAHTKFTAATTGIDKTIEALEKQIKNLREIKANFEAAEQKLLKANEIAEEDLTVKKLTHGNSTIRKMIEDARKKDNGI